MDQLLQQNETKTSTILIKFVFILILAAAAVYLILPSSSLLFGKEIGYRLGLDLQGGTQLIYQADLSRIDPSLHDNAMASVRDVIERRVNAFGVSEPVVQISGDDRLLVELPGVTNVDDAVRQIGETPFLEFREENLDIELPENIEELDLGVLFVPTELTGAHLQRAEVTFSGSTSALNTPEVTLIFNDEGRRLLTQITERNIGRGLAIYLDGLPIVDTNGDGIIDENDPPYAPIVNSAIPDGQAVITGNFTIEEARELATRLNSGALPVPIQLLSQQNVGPSLGQIAVVKSLVAGLLGCAAVGLFMILFYRLPGLLATVALIIYTALSLAIFKLIGVTFTTASITGFILSVGIAIDANILIFERMKEELRVGKTLQQALHEGFRRAWPSVRDSNLSSLLTAVVLFTSTGIIRGFALTLGIGILVSMFTAITITRTLLQIVIRVPAFNRTHLFGVVKAS